MCYEAGSGNIQLQFSVLPLVESMPYIYFSDGQRLRASSVDLTEFLRHQGEKLIRSGLEFRLASDHSITIRGSEWFDHAADQSPSCKISMASAIRRLSHVCWAANREPSMPPSRGRSNPKKEFALPPANQNMRRVYAYLLKRRFLDRNAVNAFVHAGLLYESCEKLKGREYHNAVFVGKDKNGVTRHVHKRSVNDIGRTFRINVESSGPRCSFHHTGFSDRLYVFVAPIDLLSFLTRYPRGWW